MSMIDWAEKEIEAAKKRERQGSEDNSWDCGWADYGCACYDSALKAYKSLMEDGHSGMSFGFTKDILIKLMDNIPLSPITDEDFFINGEGLPAETESLLKRRKLKSHLQCPRRTSLFREEHLDGTITYHDVDRVVGQELDSEYNTFYSGRVAKYVNDLFPITMPYTPPTRPYKVITDTFLYNKELNKYTDWDTEAYIKIITPEGDEIPINKFYKTIDTGEIEMHPFETYVDSSGNVIEPISRPILKEVEIDESEWLQRRNNSRN